MAAGSPISDEVADQAAAWLTLFMSGEVGEQERRRWQFWREAHPDNERAWQHVEAVSRRLRGLDGLTSNTLSSVAVMPSPGRRKATLAMIWLGVAGATGLLGSHTQVWREASAQYRTSKGERRTWLLDDGTRLTLNTDSAVNVEYSGVQRRVVLVAGEIMVETGHAIVQGVSQERPFVVQTGQGRILALGTRFTVREQGEHTEVGVLAHRVQITPALGSSSTILHAGQRTQFNKQLVDVPQAVDQLSSAWIQGQLIAADMRLGDFLEELGRYRSGIVMCDPAVADLRFSAVFPLQDTDRILAMLPNSLPVQIRSRTRYWITVEPENYGS